MRKRRNRELLPYTDKFSKLNVSWPLSLGLSVIRVTSLCLKQPISCRTKSDGVLFVLPVNHFVAVSFDPL